MRNYALLLIAVFLLVFSTTAGAHKVNIFAYEEAGTVYTESFFVDGTPCRNSRIVVHGPQDEILVQGTTDEEGLFSFRIDYPRDMRVVLEASMGHKNEITLDASKMSGFVEEEGEKDAVAETKPEPERIPELWVSDQRSREEVEEAVELMLEESLKPIRKELLELRKSMEKPGLTEIIGGLGWIIGLAGAYLWGTSRRK